jgi:hypothetical protein
MFDTEILELEAELDKVKKELNEYKKLDDAGLLVKANNGNCNGCRLLCGDCGSCEIFGYTKGIAERCKEKFAEVFGDTPDKSSVMPVTSFDKKDQELSVQVEQSELRNLIAKLLIENGFKVIPEHDSLVIMIPKDASVSSIIKNISSLKKG